MQAVTRKRHQFEEGCSAIEQQGNALAWHQLLAFPEAIARLLRCRLNARFGIAEFLNRLMQRTGCGLLLDLHNVYTNAVNHGFDACRFLRSLDLDRVVEIHVAGGEPMMGFHTDSHTGPVAEGVWQLLECVAPHTSSLRGVTFEFHESSWPMLHDAGVLAQLDRARSVLREYRTAPRRVA